MCEKQFLNKRCEEGHDERVGKFEILSKEREKGKEEVDRMHEDSKEQTEEMIEQAKQKVKLWLTNNFGEPDVVELMMPAR